MINQFNFRRTIDFTLWWGGVIGLILLSQLRIESLLYQLQNGFLKFLVDPSVPVKTAYLVLNFVSPIRGIVLWVSLLLIATPVVRGVYKSMHNNQIEIKPVYFLQTIVLFIFLLLAFKTWGLSGLSEEYANTSLVMFSRVSTVSYHQRLLMPALAYLLFFRGDLWYLFFSFLCLLVFLFTIVLWFHSNQVQISYWKLFSLGTLSFVSFQIIVPGYPDVLVGIFILLAFIFNLNTQAKLSLFVLSLVSHEASLIIWFSLALVLFDSKGFRQFLLISAIYIMLMLTVNTTFSGVLSSRDVGDTSSLMWVLNYPNRELLGILFGFKALWIAVIGAMLYLIKNKMYIGFLQILFIIGAGFFMTLLGVDTSRLFSWAFMAVLLSWKILSNAGGRWEVLLNTALAINLIVPSLYVQLITEPSITQGLYSTIINILFY